MQGSATPPVAARTTPPLTSPAQPMENSLRPVLRLLAPLVALVLAASPAAALSLIRDAEIEQTLGADRVSAVPGGGGLAGQHLDLHRRGRRAECLRRRRPEHLRPYRPPDRARLDRPDPCGSRARARTHHRRSPQPARAVAARRARHRRDRHDRRRRRRGRRQPGGRGRHRHGHRPGGAAHGARAQPGRGGERRPGRPALPGSRGQRPGGDPRGARSFPRAGRADRRLCRSLRAEPSALERPHRDDRGSRRQDAEGRRAVGRGRILACADGGEADRFPREPGPDLAPVSAGGRLRGRPPRPHRRLAPAAGPRASHRRRRRADRGSPRRSLLPRAQGPDSCSNPAAPPRRRTPTGRRPRWRRSSR